MRFNCRSLWVLTPLLLLGCQLNPVAPQRALAPVAMGSDGVAQAGVRTESVHTPYDANTSAQALAWAAQMLAQPAPVLQAEVKRLAALPESLRRPLQTLQLALLLGPNPLHAEPPIEAATPSTQAQALLQSLLLDPSEAARSQHPLARLLLHRWTEQKRLEDLLERQNQLLREQQRRIDQLNDRLEAMRAIERSLTSRPSSAPHTASSPAPRHTKP